MKLILLTLILCSSAVCGSEPVSQSPETVTREFFAFLLNGFNRRDASDIANNSASQQRWLTPSLRRAMSDRDRWLSTVDVRHSAAAVPPQAADNGMFIGAWDPPSSFKVVRSIATPFTAIVTIRCDWGRGTQYHGDTRFMSFLLERETGVWRVADIHTHAGKFCSDGRLSDTLNARK